MFDPYCDVRKVKEIGISLLDIVFSLLTFEGFATESFGRKTLRVVTYPLVLILVVGIVIWYITMMLLLTFKSR